MNGLDLVILGIVGMSLLYSAWKGFVRDVFSIAGIIGAFLIASFFYRAAAGWVERWVPSQTAGLVIGYILLFILSYLIIRLVGRAVWGGVRALRMGWLDRTAGFAFGFLKGVLICAGLLVVLRALLGPDDTLTRRSSLAPYVMQITREITRLVPGRSEGRRAETHREREGPKRHVKR